MEKDREKEEGKEVKEVTKIPYRPITVTEIAALMGKYRELTDYEAACKMLVDEELLILKKATIVNESTD